jgi:hypothetical protein
MISKGSFDRGGTAIHESTGMFLRSTCCSRIFLRPKKGHQGWHYPSSSSHDVEPHIQVESFQRASEERRYRQIFGTKERGHYLWNLLRLLLYPEEPRVVAVVKLLIRVTKPNVKNRTLTLRGLTCGLQAKLPVGVCSFDRYLAQSLSVIWAYLPIRLDSMNVPRLHAETLCASSVPDCANEMQSHGLTAPQASVATNHRKLRQIALKNYAE